MAKNKCLITNYGQGDRKTIGKTLSEHVIRGQSSCQKIKIQIFYLSFPLLRISYRDIYVRLSGGTSEDVHCSLLNIHMNRFPRCVK